MTFILQDWAAIAEIIGGIAVLVTLVYLSVQVRQANHSLRTSTSVMGSEFNGAIFQEWVKDPLLVEICLRGFKDLSSLDAVEKFRFIMFVNQGMRYFEHQYVLHTSDALPPGIWDGQEMSFRIMLSAPGFREAWLRQESAFSVPFQKYIEELLGKPPLPATFEDLIK